jgi:hypothetical protein
MELEPAGLAECLQRQSGRRIGKIRGLAVRLEQHAGRHVLLPQLHRLAEDPIVDAPGVKVGSNREAIWAGPDHCDMY